MTPEQKAAIESHMQAIAEILYEDTPHEQLETLEDIETAIRTQLLEYIGPQLTLFLSAGVLAQAKGANESWKAVLEVSILAIAKLKFSKSKNRHN